MAANPTVYCLEKLTDYSEFERLCHDLMFLEGYSFIEPLGGFKDKGRDAIHINKSNQISIFAYSVRDDWKYKLSKDAANIDKHNHTCNELIFVTTSQPTTGERDKAIANIWNKYGWRLDIYGLERLRVLLDVKHPTIRSRYPQIFPPAFFANLDENKLNLNKLSTKRLEAYEKLFYEVHKATHIIEALFELEELVIEEKQAIAYAVGLGVAELTDKNIFYLDDEVTVHVVGSFVGIEDIFAIDDTEAHNSEIENFRKNIRNAYRMIESIRDTGRLAQSIKSPLLEYYRHLRKNQDEKDQEY